MVEFQGDFLSAQESTVHCQPLRRRLLMISRLRFALIASCMTPGLGSAIALAEPVPDAFFTVAHESSDPHPEADAHSPSTSMDMAPDEHHHESMEIPDGVAVPSVDLIIHPDAMQGWNLEVQVTNFTFAPERVNASTLPTEGHAHLFINGEKSPDSTATGTT